jgi:hypothetical protein
MTPLEEVVETLWMYATPEYGPDTLDWALESIKPFGDVAVEGLTWAIGQDDEDLQWLSLQLLREFGTKGAVAIPALVHCIETGSRLIRLSAMEAAGELKELAASVAPLIQPYLISDDEMERVMAAGNLWRISRSPEALEVLQQAIDMTDLAAGYVAADYLRETEWDGNPPEDWLFDLL